MTPLLRASAAAVPDPSGVAVVQPELLGALHQLSPRGRSLDVGCGSGAAVLALADMGVDAWGIDVDPRAVAAARRHAADLGLRATFVLGDALRSSELGQRFDVVTDSGLFHSLPRPRRSQLVAASWASMRPGAHYVLLGVHADRDARGVTEDELCDAFLDGWTEVLVRPARFHAEDGATTEPALLGIFRRD